MKSALSAAALCAALFASEDASAATIALAQNESLMITLNGVDSSTLSFAVPKTDSYTNFGGYIRWSTRQDGRKDDDGPWGACLECGYSGGGWSVFHDPWSSATLAATDLRPVRPTRANRRNADAKIPGDALFIDFGETRETVYLWVKSTHGAGSVSYDDPASAAMPAVPLPAGGVLLATAFGVFALLRRRKAA